MLLPGKMEYAKQVAEENENLKAFADQMTNAVTRTRIPHWSAAGDSLTDGFFSLVAGEKTPKEVAMEIRKVREN